MDLRIVGSYEELSAVAADLVSATVRVNPEAVLGLATGSTPEGMYARLVQQYLQGELDFSSITTFNLDEYAGIPTDHPQSYHVYMRRHFFDHVNVKPQNINIPRCDRGDCDSAAQAYEQSIVKAGGIDLQVLGIGVNGHIGFNEPADHLTARTHLVDLAAETINANSRFFGSAEKVPRQALTMGVGSIMKAKKIVILACGEQKARAIGQALGGRINTRVPATLLQLHRDVSMVIDRAAAALIE